MLDKPIQPKTRFIAAAATTLGALALLVVPTAQAQPRCVQFGFPGDVQLRQSNGWDVTFSSTDATASGPAQATGASGAKMNGTISGGIERRNINLVIAWAGGPTASYTGVVGDDYHMSGTTGTATYRSVFPISCLTLADPPPPQPPLEGPIPADPGPQPPRQGPLPPESMSKRVTVNGDVEVYDVPGGGGTVIGELDGGEGQQVSLFRCKPDNWCHVAFAGGPDGKGWVWGAYLDRPGA